MSVALISYFHSKTPSKYNHSIDSPFQPIHTPTKNTMMGSQSKSSISIILCLVAIVAMATTIQAQLHTSPERYRSINLQQQQQQQQDTLGGKELGRQRQKRQRNLRKKNERKTQDGGSEMSLSSKLTINLSEMSLPLVDADFDLSLPMDLPTTTQYENVVLENGSSGDGSTPILASFLAGISALTVGAVALFVKMRRVHGRQVEETEEDDTSNEMHEMPFDSDDILADLEGGGRENMTSCPVEETKEGGECHEMRVVPLDLSGNFHDEVDDFAGVGHEIIIS
mmetsp:Transcript_11668/g.28680  ORF Transcript_11668/g.28680 Transcript_11668/m.28680 type:complete len:282 (+) Transcript_11668:3-848(+)